MRRSEHPRHQCELLRCIQSIMELDCNRFILDWAHIGVAGGGGPDRLNY